MTAALPAMSAQRSLGPTAYSLSVSRAMQLLNLFTPDRSEIGISEMSRELDLPKGSVQRLVHALHRHDFLVQSPQTRKYRIGVGAFQIGSLFVGSRTLERVAEPFMRDLVAELGHTCHFSVLRDRFMIVTTSIEGPGPIKYSVPIGYRLPVHTSAVGKAALALLSEAEVDTILARCGMPKRTPHSLTDPGQLKRELRLVRSRGYSVNWEENRPGAGSVAAPIAAQDGTPTAVISIGFPVSFVRKKDLPVFGAAVARTAEQLSEKFWPTAAPAARSAARRPTASQRAGRASSRSQPSRPSPLP